MPFFAAPRDFAGLCISAVLGLDLPDGVHLEVESCHKRPFSSALLGFTRDFEGEAVYAARGAADRILFV